MCPSHRENLQALATGILTTKKHGFRVEKFIFLDKRQTTQFGVTDYSYK